MAQTVKSMPTIQETQVQSLGQEDPLEKEMATHSSILAWKIPRMEEPGGLYSPWCGKGLDTTEQLTHTCKQGASSWGLSVPDESHWAFLFDQNQPSSHPRLLCWSILACPIPPRRSWPIVFQRVPVSKLGSADPKSALLTLPYMQKELWG